MLKRFTYLLFGVTFALLTLLSTKAVAVGPTFTITNVKNECNGDAGGSFDIKVTAATGTNLSFTIFGPGPPFTDIINTPVTGVTLPYTFHVSGASTGGYTIIVKDIAAAPPQGQTIVNYTSISLSAQTITNNTVCGASAGAIDITVTGGSGTYSYLWSNAAITEDISGLTTGTYSVTITDPNSSCLLNQSFQVKDPQPVDFAISTSTPTVCAGDNIIINCGQPTASGPGENGVSYQLKVNGVNVLAPQVGDGVSTITFTLPSSLYAAPITVEATLSPCTPKSSNNNLTVVVNALPVVSAPSANLCVGSTMTLSPSSGGTWISNNPGVATVAASTGVVTGVSAGSVTFTFTNTATTCSNTTSSVTITAAPTATISYAGTPFCKSIVGTQSVALSGTGAFSGGTYSALPAGLTINSSTGDITPSSSTANTYTVTYTIPASGGCAAVPVTTSVTITAAPTATISYAGTPFCKSIVGTQSVALSGTGAFSGGTYSALPAGLTINSSTGDITPSSSTANTYTVTYTIPASGGCAAVPVTTSVTITAAPTATISYAGTPFCKSIVGTQSVALSGTGAFSGGTYSALPAGLTINSSTGDITPSSSTANTYTVTYTIPASGGCAAVPVTTSVTITAAPTATISYAGTPFCKSIVGTQSVALSGTGAFSGGTYSALPAGLTINSSTGDITPSSSTANTYTVTYTIPASGGCAAVPVTTSVTITAAPTATISYAGTPFCKSIVGTQSVALSGTGAFSGGTYSALPAGLTINSSTGDITPSSSTANTYTVTYTIPASGGCAAVPVTTSVTITAVPTATISYAGTPFCKSIVGTQSVALSGTGAFSGGTYSALPAGLTINSSTGDITPSSSTANTYTVTYTIPASGGCAAVPVTTSVTITAAPTATISYAGTPFCKSIVGTQSVALSGTGAFSGGTYSALPAGLTINSSTGDITPSSSTANTYTVTYTIPASGGCAAVPVTTSVTITAAPTATISYAGTPFCKSIVGTQSVALSGTGAFSGGTYSALPAGLTINSSTGDITPSSSTASTYTVTYTIPASGGCAAVPVTTSVTITAAPTATISYAGTPFCKSIVGTQSVALSGTGAFSGGTYSALPAGLTINSSTGDITPSSSTASTYTVTYTIPASGGCAAVPVTTSVTITAAPTATISYAGTPFCKSIVGTQSVALSGTGAFSGGTYSALPAGLTINSSTGDITPSSSTANTYTVTYTIPASGGCAAVPVTTSVTITAVPTATISYAGTPFCKSIVGTQSVALSGTGAFSGGTYSALPAGLTINSSTGDITPSSSTANTYTVTYTIPASGGCAAVPVTTSVTINALPTITGTLAVCLGSTTLLTGSGTAAAVNPWVSSNLAVATVDNAGLVTGVSVGTSGITYTDNNGCQQTASVTVNALPVVSALPASICVGSTANLTPNSGGTWVSSDATKATITNGGVVTGVAAAVGITFTFTDGTTGCSKTTTSTTIQALPVVSAPPASICVGSTANLTPNSGGTWVSSDVTKATITNGGVVTGVAAAVGITFTFTDGTTGCSKTTTSTTINALPVVSAPPANICIGSTANLTPNSGGTWVSSDVTKATITNGGVVTGVAAAVGITFTFTDGTTGCSSTTSTVTINTNPTTSTITGITPICANTTGVSYRVVNTAGSTYAWTITGGVQTGGNTSHNITVTWGAAGAGNVKVIETNAAGCAGTPVNFPVTINANPAFSTVVTNVTTCTPGNDGSIVVTASGGSGAGYTYSKDNGVSFQVGTTFSSLGAGNYLVEVKDGGGCTSPANTVTVNPPPGGLTFSTVKQDVSCNGGNNGSTTITPSGGSGTYTYSKDNGATFTGSGSSFTFGSLIAATYQIVVKDGNGCQFISSVIIGQPAAVSFTTAKTDATCNGNTDGTITVTASGGNNTYSYSKDNGATFQPGNVFNGLAVATYQIVVKDGNNCLASMSSVAVGQPLAVSFTSVKTDPTTCVPGNDGTITVTPSGGNGTYQYSKDNGATFQASNLLSGLVAGSYQVVVQDGNNCHSSASAVLLTAPGGLTFTNTKQDVSCNGGNTGSITITSSGGNGTYTYSNDNGVTFSGSGSPFTFNSLTAATYQLVVKDGNGCQFSGSAIIAEPAAVTFTAVNVNVTCNGGANGSITLTTSGGNNTYKYSIDNGTTFQNGNSFTSLAAGSHQTIVKDGNGCLSAVSTIVITEPAIVSFTTAKTDATTCTPGNDGTITVTASGGNGTYQYSKDNGATFQASNQFTGLPAATYQVVVKDGNNCPASSASVVIATPALPNATFSGLSGPYCTSSGSVTLTPTTAGGTFSGTGISGSVFSPSTAGVGTFPVQYSITASGCTSTSTQSVDVINSAVDASFSGLNPTYCPGSPSATLTAVTSGGTFSGAGISGNAFSPSTAGSGNHVIQYSVTSGGCTSSTTQNVNVLLSTDPLCTSGGGTGTCATVVITPKPSPATCTNSNGKIIFSIKPFVPIVNNTGVKISITGTSSTSLAISRTNFNDSSFNNLPLGTYSYSIEYGDPSCTKTGQVTVDQSGTVGTPIASNLIDAVCFGTPSGALTLDVPGETGNLLEWSLDGTTWTSFTAGNQITGIPAGAPPSFQRVISVRRNSSDPCFAAVTATINNAVTDILISSAVADATCLNNDGSIVVNSVSGGTGPYSYQFDGNPKNNTTFNGLAGGNHVFTVVDANNCTKNFPLTVNFPGLVNFTTSTTSPTCNGGGNDAVVTATITSSGTFAVGITTDPINDPTAFQTIVSGGGAQVIFGGLSQGTYYVVAKPSGALCPSRSLGIAIGGGPVAVDFGFEPKDFVCFETKGMVRVFAIKGSSLVDFNYEILSEGNVMQSGTITYTQSLPPDTTDYSGLDKGDYQIRLFQDQSAASGCATPISSNYKPFSINGPTATLDTLYVNRKFSLPNLPTGSMLVGIKESKEEPYQAKLHLVTPHIQGQKNNFAFDSTWVNVPRNNETQVIEFNAANLYAGDYHLSIRDTLGCSKTYDLAIIFDTDIFVPNVFTPNNDGKNDTFYILNLPSNSSLVVTNRWGKEVYHANNYGENNSWWNGGAEVDGIYFYRLTSGGKVYTGWVEIMHPTY